MGGGIQWCKGGGISGLKSWLGCWIGASNVNDPYGFGGTVTSSIFSLLELRLDKDMRSSSIGGLLHDRLLLILRINSSSSLDESEIWKKGLNYSLAHISDTRFVRDITKQVHAGSESILYSFTILQIAITTTFI